EAVLPLRIESFSLREDSAGPGEFRGGLGFSKVYRILAPCLLQTNLDRTKHPAWGVLGGSEGRPGRIAVRDGENGPETPAFKARGQELAPGQFVILETGGGGGYGPARERDLSLVQRDLDQ